MKNIIKNIKEKIWIQYLIIFIIGLLIAIPFIWTHIRLTDDGWLHLTRTISIDKAISDGNFPFLISPYICRNFGYSMTAFYPPIVSYIPYFIGLLTSSYIKALKIFASLTIGLSGIFMYKFIYEVTSNKRLSFLSAIIYMVIPYRLEVLFNRFAIGEFTAFVFMPIVFQGLYNLLQGNGKKHFYIAIGAIGLILSHTISTIFTALFCCMYIIFNIKKFLKKDVLIKCLVNVIFIVLISAFFLVPMLEFKSAAKYTIFEPNAMRTSGEYTSKNTIELWQFIKDKGEENGVSFLIGIPTMIMLCITILAYKYIPQKYKDFYITNFILGIISIFMCTKAFPWIYMPQIICNIQYPWRLVGFAMFFLTPVLAMNVYYLIKCIKKEKWKNLIYICTIILIGIFTILELTAYNPTQSEDITEEERELEIRNNPIISHFSVNRDYMPHNALVKQYGYVQEREDRVYVLSGNANIYEENKNGLHLVFYINNVQQNTELELPYLFYPGYAVILNTNNKEIKLNYYESDNGFVTIMLPEGTNEGYITLEYTGTLLEKVSYGLSLISLCGFIGCEWYESKKTKKG